MTTTRADVQAAAEAVATQNMLVESLGMMNTPTKIDKRIAADARYMIELDILAVRTRAYQAALRAFVLDGEKDAENL